MLDRLQLDTHAFLRAVPALATARHLVDNVGDIEAKVARALVTLDDSSGKMGLAIITMAPEVSSASANLPGPLLEVEQQIQIIEQVLINRDPAKGTLIRSAAAALTVLSALHHHTVGGFTFYADSDPISPLPVKPGYVSHAVKIVMRLALPVQPRVAGVAAAWDGTDDTLVLTCATTGASIYYTTDGSYPRPGGGGTHPYAGPIAHLAASAAIRSAAYLAGSLPGPVLELTITA